MTVLLLFAGAVLAASIVPGPDFAMVTRNTVLSGRGSGMWTALGVAAGVGVWIAATAAGLAALLAASALAFTAVKVAGAAYLIYLGVRSIIAALKDRRRPAGELDLGRRMSHAAAFRSGLLCNLLNPKAAVFFTALMPQFIDGGAHWVRVSELALAGMAANGLWFLALANLVGLLRHFLTRPRVRAWLNGVTGTVMIAFGVRVAAN